MFAQLLGAPFGKRLHVVLAAEVQAAGGAGLDARWLEPFAHAIRTQRALENTFRLRIQLRDIERASRDAVTATDAVSLLKIDDAVGVLHDRAVGGASRHASAIRAKHAIVLSHEPHPRGGVAPVVV